MAFALSHLEFNQVDELDNDQQHGEDYLDQNKLGRKDAVDHKGKSGI